MRIVLDTNCLIQIIPRKAEHRWMYDAIFNGRITVCVSTEIILEYEEMINSFYDSQYLGGSVVNSIMYLPKTIKKNIYYNWYLIDRDPDDNKYVDLAVAANAETIVSNDSHFRVLKSVPYPIISCMNLDEFKKYWDKNIS